VRSAFTYSPSDRKRNRSFDEGLFQWSPLGGSRRFDRGPMAQGISVTDKTGTGTNVGGKTSLNSFQEGVNGTDQVVSQKFCLITSTWKVVIPVYQIVQLYWPSLHITSVLIPRRTTSRLRRVLGKSARHSRRFMEPQILESTPLDAMRYWFVSAVKRLDGCPLRRSSASVHRAQSLSSTIQRSIGAFSILSCFFHTRIDADVTPYTPLPPLWSESICCVVGAF
jgi:hypothetical protein